MVVGLWCYVVVGALLIAFGTIRYCQTHGREGLLCGLSPADGVTSTLPHTRTQADESAAPHMFDSKGARRGPRDCDRLADVPALSVVQIRIQPSYSRRGGI
jgi:hypothetical protein